jgi:hypothetical protein
MGFGTVLTQSVDALDALGSLAARSTSE